MLNWVHGSWLTVALNHMMFAIFLSYIYWKWVMNKKPLDLWPLLRNPNHSCHQNTGANWTALEESHCRTAKYIPLMKNPKPQGSEFSGVCSRLRPVMKSPRGKERRWAESEVSQLRITKTHPNIQCHTSLPSTPCSSHRRSDRAPPKTSAGKHAQTLSLRPQRTAEYIYTSRRTLPTPHPLTHCIRNSTLIDHWSLSINIQEITCLSDITSSKTLQYSYYVFHISFAPTDWSEYVVPIGIWTFMSHFKMYSMSISALN